MNEQSKAARMNGTSPSAGCAVPILGADDQPIGTIRFVGRMADEVAQVSYLCGTSYALVPTVMVENGKAKLVAVRIQHNAESEALT